MCWGGVLETKRRKQENEPSFLSNVKTRVPKFLHGVHMQYTGREDSVLGEWGGRTPKSLVRGEKSGTGWGAKWGCSYKRVKKKSGVDAEECVSL